MEDITDQYEREDAASPPPRNSIIFTGRSSVAFWATMREDMAPLTVINRGLGGSTLDDLLGCVESLVLKHHPRAIVLYGGDNDISEANLPADQVLERLGALFTRIHAGLPRVRTYVLSIKPSVLRWTQWPEMKLANNLMRGFCDRTQNACYVDVATPMLNSQARPRPDLFEDDGLHLSRNGYALWASVLRPTLLLKEHKCEPSC